MRHVGLERPIDNLGRISLPIEYRRLYNWKEKDKVYVIGTEQGVLIYRKEYKLTAVNDICDI